MNELKRNLKFVWNYSKYEKKRLIIFIILSLFETAISIALPLVSARIIVELTSNKLSQFIFMGMIFLILWLISDTIGIARGRLFQKIYRNTYVNLQTSLGSEILKLNNKTLENNSSGVFIQRLLGDTSNISTIFTDLSNYFKNIIRNIGIIFTYFVLSKPMFVFIIIASIIRFVLETKRINVRNEYDKEYRKINDETTGFASEIVRGAEDIKMLNGEFSFISELKNKFSKLNNQKYIMENVNLNYRLVRMYFADFSFFLMICLVAYQIYTGSISIAVGVIIYNFGNSYNSLVANIVGIQETIKKFNLSATRIFDIFTSKEYEKEKFGDKHLDKVNGDFEFKGVYFKYKRKNVLKNLSFKVHANETVAFVGKSGAGKTTIFNLLCKMYDNYKGTITIDGINIKELDKESIRGNITIVSQNPYIFNMSIKDNLKIVKKDLTNKEMKEALKMAYLDEFVESLPEKYDTIVGEGGINLSGGQKQRLAIARAFVQKTEIILFDEATSSLDNIAQREIQRAIDNLQKDYTILIIAHRLSTIQNADRIMVLDNGKIVAEGKHEKLLKTCEEYREIYESEIEKK